MKADPHPSPAQASTKMAGRPYWPLRLKLLAWLIVLFTLWNIVRAITGIAWFGTLAQYATPPGPIYIVATGVVWVLAGLFLIWCMLRGKAWTRIAILTGSGLYALWFWVDRLIVQPGVRANWAFTLVVTILFLAFMAAVVLDPRIQSILEREAYERESKYPPSERDESKITAGRRGSAHRSATQKRPSNRKGTH